jgi:hypothetical protein
MAPWRGGISGRSGEGTTDGSGPIAREGAFQELSEFMDAVLTLLDDTDLDDCIVGRISPVRG